MTVWVSVWVIVCECMWVSVSMGVLVSMGVIVCA